MSQPGRTDTAAWRKAKAQAIRDAQGQCQLCGRDLDPTAPKTTPMSTEVDHVTPLAMGGEPYARENLRALHRAVDTACANSPHESSALRFEAGGRCCVVL
jgi:5-methylcytosine-specific restriction endonuclease McrA